MMFRHGEQIMLLHQALRPIKVWYERESVTTLDREFLHTVKTKAGAYVIYADLCTLSSDELEAFHITFKKIPRDIAKL